MRETGLSVPDADLLLRIAEILEVPVSQLLGTEPDHTAALAEELASLNAQLAAYQRKEARLQQVSRKRGWILFCSFLAMLVILLVRNAVLSLLLTGLCLTAALIVLYRNLALLTSITTEDLRMGALRATTLFDIVVLTVGILAALLIALDVLPVSAYEERLFAMALIACVMIFGGIVSPRLPYNRHTGLRLPWTVADADTWYLAHRILGMLSIPLALLYVACSLTIADFELVTLAAMALWIGIPGGISFWFFYQKSRGNIR